jgi:hypothetical protein
MSIKQLLESNTPVGSIVSSILSESSNKTIYIEHEDGGPRQFFDNVVDAAAAVQAEYGESARFLEYGSMRHEADDFPSNIDWKSYAEEPANSKGQTDLELNEGIYLYVLEYDEETDELTGDMLATICDIRYRK